MRTFFILLMIIVSVHHLQAQTPQKMSYQAVIRDGNGQLMKNRNLGMQVSVVQGSENGTVVFAERFFPSTNENALVTLQIGNGLSVNGSFSDINWMNGPYFIKTETDINGGANYTLSATSQLLSIPYALMAKNVENVPSLIMNDLIDVDAANIQAGQLLKWDGTNWKPANDATTGNSGPSYTAGPGISINTSNVIANTGDNDNDSSNELQQLSIVGNVLSLSKTGGSINLPSSGGGDHWGTQTVVTNNTLTGNGTQNNPLGLNSNSINSNHVQDQSITSSDLGSMGAQNGQVLKWSGQNWIPSTDEVGSNFWVANTNGKIQYNGTGTIVGNDMVNARLDNNQLSFKISSTTLPMTYFGDKIFGRGPLTFTEANSSEFRVGVNQTNFLALNSEGIAKTTTLGSDEFYCGFKDNFNQNIKQLRIKLNGIEVLNGIKIGKASSVTPVSDGTIQFDNGDLLGRVNGQWKSLTSGGLSGNGATTFIPYFTNNNTLANSNLTLNSITGQVSLNGGVNGDLMVKNSANVQVRIFASPTAAFIGSLSNHDLHFIKENKSAISLTSNSTSLGTKYFFQPFDNINADLGSLFNKWDKVYANFIIGAKCASDWIPTANGTMDLGNIDFLWDKIYVDEIGGHAYIDGNFRPSTDEKRSLGISTNKWLVVHAKNGTIQTSDRRLKKNITPVSYGLKDVMKIKPVTWEWKNDRQPGTFMGFVAQDLLEVVPSAVYVPTEEDFKDYEEAKAAGKSPGEPSYGIKYAELIPVLTKAIQEQQEMIDAMRKEIDELKKQK